MMAMRTMVRRFIGIVRCLTEVNNKLATLFIPSPLPITDLPVAADLPF